MISLYDEPKPFNESLIDLKLVSTPDTIVGNISSREFFVIFPDQTSELNRIFIFDKKGILRAKMVFVGVGLNTKLSNYSFVIYKKFECYVLLFSYQNKETNRSAIGQFVYNFQGHLVDINLKWLTRLVISIRTNQVDIFCLTKGPFNCIFRFDMSLNIIEVMSLSNYLKNVKSFHVNNDMLVTLDKTNQVNVFDIAEDDFICSFRINSKDFVLWNEYIVSSCENHLFFYDLNGNPVAMTILNRVMFDFKLLSYNGESFSFINSKKDKIISAFSELDI